MKKKKILMMIDQLVGGGAERVLRDIINNINMNKYDIDILLVREQGVYLEDIKGKCNVYSLSGKIEKPKNVILRKIKGLFRLIKIKYRMKFNVNNILKNNYDIEISFLQGPTIEFIALRSTNAKKISWIHTDMIKRNVSDKQKKKDGIYLRKFNKIIAVSKDSAESVKKLYPDLSDKIEVIYNPVDKNLINNMASEYKVEFDKNRLNFISLGRLHTVKGYDLLLKAHKELIEEGYDHNIYILGEGLEEKNLRKYIEKNNLENSAKLLGFNKNPYPYVRESDIFISSSRYEGFSLALAEAMILNKPVIATDSTGPIELLNNGEFGMLAKTESVESLKEAMKIMIESETKRDYYKKQSIERTRIFDINQAIKEIESLFDNI